MQLPLMEPERTQLVQKFADLNELKTEQNTEPGAAGHDWLDDKEQLTVAIF